MDEAIVGNCRIGYFRIGVYLTVFDDAIEQLEDYSPIESPTIPIPPAEDYPLAVFDETDFDFCIF